MQGVVGDEPPEEEGEVLHRRRLVPSLRPSDDDAPPLRDILHHVGQGLLDVAVEVDEVESRDLFKSEWDILEMVGRLTAAKLIRHPTICVVHSHSLTHPVSVHHGQFSRVLL